MAALTSSSFACVRPTSTTIAPSSASVSAVARPMPVPAPVTTTTSLLNCSCFNTRFSLRGHSGAPRSGEPGIHTPQQWLWIPALASLGRNDRIYVEKGTAMPVVIRMARAGTKKRPVYHIVAADSRAPRDGRFIERLGYFNPLLPKEKTERLKLDLEKVQAWMKKGAQPSDRVMRFLDAAGIMKRPKRNNPEKAVPRKERKAKEEEAAKAAGGAPAAEGGKPAEKAAEKPAKADKPAEATPAPAAS